MSIESKARVKVTHNPAHDTAEELRRGVYRRRFDGCVGRVERVEDGKALVSGGAGGALWFFLDELTPVDAPDVCEDIKVIERASERLNREMQEGRALLLSCRKGLDEWRDKATRAEGEVKFVRADLEALQAAVCGLTGKEGTVSEMVTDLAGVGRDMAALKAAVEAATGQKRDKVADLVLDLGAMTATRIELERREIVARSDAEDATIALAKEQSVRRGAVEARDVLDARLQVSARVASALRTLLRDGDAMAVLRCLDDLDKALRGMPLGETRRRQGERFHRPAIDLRPEDLPGFVASLDQHVLGLEQRLTALEYGREFPAPSEGKS